MTEKDKISVDELAEALYEGTPVLRNLAENLARQYGQADALSFYGLMGEDIQNFYKFIAVQLIEHAMEWEKNNGCACVLSKRENVRLKMLPRNFKPGEFNDKIIIYLTRLILVQRLRFDSMDFTVSNAKEPSTIKLKFATDEERKLAYDFLCTLLPKVEE